MPRFSLSNTRLSAWKLIALGGFLTFLLTLYTLHPSSSSLLPSSLTDVFSRPPIQTTPCPPRLWASGQWEPISPRAPSSANVSSPADVLALDGFQGCASDREYKWHLAAEEDQFDRFPDVVSYVWTPPETCDVRSLEGRGREQLVKELVEDGGWLLIGGEYFILFPAFTCPLLACAWTWFAAICAEKFHCPHPSEYWPSILSSASPQSVLRACSTTYCNQPLSAAAYMQTPRSPSLSEPTSPPANKPIPEHQHPESPSLYPVSRSSPLAPCFRNVTE